MVRRRCFAFLSFPVRHGDRVQRDRSFRNGAGARDLWFCIAITCITFAVCRHACLPAPAPHRCGSFSFLPPLGPPSVFPFPSPSREITDASRFPATRDLGVLLSAEFGYIGREEGKGKGVEGYLEVGRGKREGEALWVRLELVVQKKSRISREWKGQQGGGGAGGEVNNHPDV